MLITVSKMRRRSLIPAACGRTMATMEKGNDSTKYPLAIALATTKNLHQFIYYYNFRYICMYVCVYMWIDR